MSQVFTCVMMTCTSLCVCWCCIDRGSGSQRWSNSTPGHIPPWSPPDRLGSPWPHLQGPVAAAHPLHACRPGEVFPRRHMLGSAVCFSCEHHLLSARFCRYNVVFRYLLSVRRVQSQLQHCWALQMQRKHLKSTQTDAVKWRLRNHMAFLIDNLQYYLQVMMYLYHAETTQQQLCISPLTTNQKPLDASTPNLLRHI